MIPTIITNTVPTIIIALKCSTKITPLGLGSEFSLSIANTLELPKVNTNIPSNKVIIFFMLFSPNLHVQSLHFFISCISLSFVHKKFVIKAFFLGQQSTLIFSSTSPVIELLHFDSIVLQQTRFVNDYFL